MTRRNVFDASKHRGKLVGCGRTTTMIYSSCGVRTAKRTTMVQGDGNPDDRREQLGQGETSDCLSTRRRWQKSSSKVK